MQFLTRLKAVWLRLGLIQRVILISIGAVCVLLCVFLGHWARMPDLRLLYQDLDPDEAAQITEKLTDAGIAYELRDSGSSIYAPKEQIYQIRLDMAKEGLPQGDKGGYQLFDDEKIGVSPFVQNVNLHRALQDELARSIQMIEGVHHARVHIVNPEKRLFSEDQQQASASVVLKLKPGYRIGASNIAAITHLVAGSVESVEADQVTVVDSQGRLLSGHTDQIGNGGVGTVVDYKERVERNLEEKVEDMLEMVLGPGRATVKVSAQIDMTSIDQVTEKYDPKGVPTKEEITETTEVNGSGESQSTGGTKKDSTVVSEYVIGKTVEKKMELPGEIQHLSVAAFVDLSVADVHDANAAKIMELADVEQIIKNALGLSDTDSLKVVEAKFHQPQDQFEQQGISKWPRYIAIAKHSSLGIMAVCAMLVLKILGGKKDKSAPVAVAATGQLEAGQPVTGLLTGEENNEIAALRKQITENLKKDPQHVRQLFSSWLEEN